MYREDSVSSMNFPIAVGSFVSFIKAGVDKKTYGKVVGWHVNAEKQRQNLYGALEYNVIDKKTQEIFWLPAEKIVGYISGLR